MKIRVIYSEAEIISVDRPEGAAALDYDQLGMAIDGHEVLLPHFHGRGYDVSCIAEYLAHEGVEVDRPEWQPKPAEPCSR